jgi:uncharacterized protein YycO
MTKCYPLRFGFHVGVGIISSAIRWQTRSLRDGVKYSHISVVAEDGTLLEAHEGARRVIQQRRLEEVRQFERVDTAHILLDRTGRDRAWQFLWSQLGKPYDYLMVLRFLSRRGKSKGTEGRWFCSELAYAACQAAGVPLFGRTEAWEVSPGMFSRYRDWTWDYNPQLVHFT